MTSDRELIGASPWRKEDRRLITGAGRFVDDLSRPGLLHMAVVRSGHAHARIIKMAVAGKGPGSTSSQTRTTTPKPGGKPSA